MAIVINKLKFIFAYPENAHLYLTYCKFTWPGEKLTGSTQFLAVVSSSMAFVCLALMVSIYLFCNNAIKSKKKFSTLYDYIKSNWLKSRSWIVLISASCPFLLQNYWSHYGECSWALLAYWDLLIHWYLLHTTTTLTPTPPPPHRRTSTTRGFIGPPLFSPAEERGLVDFPMSDFWSSWCKFFESEWAIKWKQKSCFQWSSTRLQWANSEPM